MKIIQIVARVVLGLIYFVFGGMGLMIALGVMKPEFPPMPAGAEAYMTGIMATGYFFPLLKVTETFCGFLVLIGRGAPLALVVLAPITLHILLFHGFLTPGAKELVLPAVMVVCQILAMSKYFNIYRPLLSRG